MCKAETTTRRGKSPRRARESGTRRNAPRAPKRRVPGKFSSNGKIYLDESGGGVRHFALYECIPCTVSGSHRPIFTAPSSLRRKIKNTLQIIAFSAKITMFSRIKKSRQNHAKRRNAKAKRQKRRRNGKQKPERYIAAPVYAFTRRWGTALGDGLGSAPRSAKRPNARAARRLQTPPPRLTAHARGAERAPRIFRKGHDCPLLWMKLPPMVGTRR